MLDYYASRGPDPPSSPPNQKRRGAPLHPLNMTPPNRCMPRLECLREGTSRALHLRGFSDKKRKRTPHSHFRTSAKGREGRALRAQCYGEKAGSVVFTHGAIRTNTTTRLLFTRCRELVKLRYNMLDYYASRGPDPPSSPPNQKRRGAPLHPLNMTPPNRCMPRLECLREGTSRALHLRGFSDKNRKRTPHSHFRTVRFPRPPALGGVHDLPGSSIGVERNNFT